MSIKHKRFLQNLKRHTSIALVVGVALALCIYTPITSAHASSKSANAVATTASSVASSVSNSTNTTDSNDTSNENTSAQSDGPRLVLPDEYYLNNLGYVTPAKYQTPWTTCWAFAVASAIESSILKAMDESPAEANMDSPIFAGLPTNIDVSERAIGWFAHELQTEASGQTQAGEGYERVNPDDLSTQFTGANFAIVASALVAQQNLISESAVPYVYNGYDGTGVAWHATPNSTNGRANARNEDWSVDDSLRVADDLGWYVRDIYTLDSPAVLEQDLNTGKHTYVGYNSQGTKEIKEALLDIGGVAISVEADSSIPGQVINGSFTTNSQGDTFNYDTWAQYNSADVVDLNHAVTIVGYDDDYPASNFASKNGGTPPSNGAWLCKNNWGGDQFFDLDKTISNPLKWGIPYDTSTGLESSTNNASGFFWLSYYDHSITTPMAFGVAETSEDTTLYQYDFLSKSEFEIPNSYTGTVKVANVFSANETELIEEVAGWTYDSAETIETWIYIVPQSLNVLDAESGALSGEDFSTILDKCQLAANQKNDFSVQGFHTIKLDSPILVTQGQEFIVVQSVHTMKASSKGEIVDSSYLALELMFTEDIEANNNDIKATVISNPNESFAAVFNPDKWMSIDEYNAWYADLKAQGNLDVDMIYGNALIKATTKSTSMASDDRVYEVVNLNPLNASQ